jgi:alpha-glucoside transport system permease protein
VSDTVTIDRAVGWRSFLLPVGAILGLAGLAIGFWILIDRQAASGAVAVLYEAIGNSAEATALRAGSGNRVIAKLVLAAVALAVGVGGIWLFYAGLNAVVMRLGDRWRRRLLPWVFVGPALLLLTLYLVWPVVATIVKSFTEGRGVANFEWALTTPANHQMFLNNFLWLIVGVAGSVGLGLLVAALVDRVKHESVAKTFVFLPLAISLVGASVIWRFVYTWRPPGQPQYGLLNAVWAGLGQEPIPWVQTPDWHINTFALIFILIWLQTGFAMVVLSAAIKGVPAEITEAARLDGATERQMFFRVVVPMIMGSIITVTITTAIVVLKVFDIVYVMTGGRFSTDVVANQMFIQAFQFFDTGRASVLAVILFVAVLPLMLVNVRNIQRQGLAA